MLPVAFVGTHVPLIALIRWAAARTGRFAEFLGTSSVALVATLAGTGVTLFVLHHLLRPIALVADALRIYRTEQEPLPTLYEDEVGQLMRDTADTIAHLARAGEDANSAEALIDRAAAAAAAAPRDGRRPAAGHDVLARGSRDIEAGAPVSAEAPSRWNYPPFGMVSLGRFIPIAETIGLIAPTGRWTLDAACASIAAWNGTGLPRQRVAINLPADQVHDAGFVDQVRAAIDMHRISPDQLDIELTKSAATTDHADTRAVFTRLRDLGVSIANDDFGTGFASLRQLRRLPFEKLKITPNSSQPFRNAPTAKRFAAR